VGWYLYTNKKKSSWIFISKTSKWNYYRDCKIDDYLCNEKPYKNSIYIFTGIFTSKAARIGVYKFLISVVLTNGVVRSNREGFGVKNVH